MQPEKEFLEISQNSQENTCVRVSFLIKLQASRTPLMAASVFRPAKTFLKISEIFSKFTFQNHSLEFQIWKYLLFRKQYPGSMIGWKNESDQYAAMDILINLSN